MVKRKMGEKRLTTNRDDKLKISYKADLGIYLYLSLSIYLR